MVFRLGGKPQVYSEVADLEGLALDFDHDIRAVIKAILRSGSPQRILLLIDEVEKIVPIAGIQPGLDGYVDLFGYVRGLSQQLGVLVSIITAANPAICEEASWAGVDNPVFKFYQETYLPPLEKHECDEMVVKLGRGMGLTFTENSLNVIYSSTGGHPFVTRQLCSRIVSLFRQRPILIRDTHVREAAADFLRDDDSTFREILMRLDQHFPAERQLLQAIAHGFNNIESLGLLANGEAGHALRHLIGYQLIERQGVTYRVKMGLLEDWLRKQSVAKVETYEA